MRKKKLKKKFTVMVMAVLAMGVLMAGPVMAQQPVPDMDEDRLAAGSQLMINLDHYFWGNDEETIGGYAYGLFLLDMNTGYSVLNGYVGAKFGDELAMYVLAATRHDSFFWHAGPSLWLGYEKDRISFVAEYDYYFPQEVTNHVEDTPFPNDQYYVYIHGGVNLKDNIQVGFAYEEEGDVGDTPWSKMWGPTVSFNNLQLWFAKQETPQIDDFDYVVIRGTINVTQFLE